MKEYDFNNEEKRHNTDENIYQSLPQILITSISMTSYFSFGSNVFVFFFFNVFTIFGGCFSMVTRGQQMIASHLSINVLQLI